MDKQIFDSLSYDDDRSNPEANFGKRFLIYIVGFISLVIFLTIFFSFRKTEQLIIKDTEISKFVTDNFGEYGEEFVSLQEIEGSNDYIVLKFYSFDTESPSVYFGIYDVASKSFITNILTDSFDINTFDASIIHYIGNNSFIIVDNVGHIYKYTPDEDIIVTYIDQIPANKENVFRSVYHNNNIYILTRRNKTDYNEVTVDNNRLFTLTLTDKKKLTYTLSEEVLDNSMLNYGFVFKQNNSLGLLQGSFINVYKDFVKKNSTVNDMSYMINKAFVDNNYKILNADRIQVKTVNSSDIQSIDKSTLTINESFLSRHIKETYEIDTGIEVIGIPIVIGENRSLYIKASYDSALYALEPYSPKELFVVDHTNNNAVTRIDDYICGYPLQFKYKDYIACFKTSNGYIGVTEDIQLETISEHDVLYLNKKINLFAKNQSIYSYK